MKFANPYLTLRERISLLQRWILVHSYLYYNLNYSVVSDEHFDNNSLQLATYQQKYPKTAKQSNYYYAMHDFDGSTGVGYFERLNDSDKEKVERDAWYLRNKY